MSGTESHPAPLPRRLVRYFHDCLVAQCDWGRAINVLDRDDATLVPLAAKEQQHLGSEGCLRMTDPDASDLAKRVIAGGSDHALMLGALFLVGRQPARGDRSEKRFCAPLLQVAMSLRQEAAGVQLLMPEDPEFTVNYSMIGELLDEDDLDDDLQDRLADLSDSVPDFPIDSEEFGAFWNSLQSVAPELPLANDLPRSRRRNVDESSRIETLGLQSPRGESAWEPGNRSLRLVDFYLPEIASDGKFRLLPATALIYGRLPGRQMSALRELREMETMDLSRTAFGSVFDPMGARLTASIATDVPDDRQANEQSPWSVAGAGACDTGAALTAAPEPTLVTAADYQPMPLTPAQQMIVNSSREAPLTVVTGPPGTGKSYTITAIVLDAILRGQKVLVASQMDKAVEVVASMVQQRVGSLAIARSGGRAAQRALAKEVSQLTGPINRLPEVSDSMIEQCRTQHGRSVETQFRLEQGLADIVRWERQWSEIHDACERAEMFCPLPSLPITARQLRIAETHLPKLIEAQQDPPGWVGRLLNRWRMSRLTGALRLPETVGEACSQGELLRQIEALVSLQRLRAQLGEIERRLRVPFPANAAWRELADLQQRRHELAAELVQLTRQRQIRDLVSMDHARSSLRDLAKSLRRRKHELKQTLQENLSAELLLECFPAWACTSRSLCEVLPSKPGLFDLVVIDESSQCDLALASVALMRARRAVVVGDPHQLRHVCFLSRAREDAALVRSELSDREHARYGYRRSLFDVAADNVDQQHFFFLDEHFRSQPQIIEFSNRRFYDQAMRIMTRRPSRKPDASVEVRYVDGNRDENSSVNRAEVGAVVEIVREVAHRPGDLSVGVVSPFRDHADAIKEHLMQELTTEQFQRLRIVVGTAHSLQGDEKDVIIFTTSIDCQSHPASLRFLESPSLFNVAITRARQRLIVVTSIRTDELPAGLLRDFLIYACQPATQSPKATQDTAEIAKSGEMPVDEVAQKLADALTQHGVDVWQDVESAGGALPLAAGTQRAELAIYCDTASGRLDDPEATAENHRRVQRADWKLIRIPHRTFHHQPDRCLEEIRNRLT